MKRIDYRRVILVSIVLSLVLIYSVLWLRMISNPTQNTGTDYIPFFTSAKIAVEESPSKVYDLNLQKNYEEKIIGFEIDIDDTNIFVNPPHVIPLVILFSNNNFIVSFIWWEIFNACLIGFGTFLLIFLIKKQVPKKNLLLFGFGILFFFPAYKSLLIGQNSAMLFLGACLLYFGVIRKRDWLAGLGLVLMCVRPHLAIPLALPFLFKRRRIFWWFLLGSMILAGFCLVYLGPDGILGFIKMLTISGSGLNTTIKEKSMINLLSFLLNLFPFISSNYLRIVSWIGYFLSIIYICFLWLKQPEINERIISFGILLIVFFSPHTHLHDLILWSIPMVSILFSRRGEFSHRKVISLLPWIISYLFLFSYFSPLLGQTIPFVILGIIILLMLSPTKILNIFSLKK